MKKKILILMVLTALAIPSLAEAPAGTLIDKKAAFMLLDSIGRMFHEMAMTGVGGQEKLEKGIQQFMSDSRKAMEQKQIDRVFFNRYARLLAIIKLVMAPDPGGILVPIIDREMGRFVGEVLGDDWKASGPAAIGQVADAIAYEIIDLQMYLENLELREKLRKDWDKKFSDVLPQKKEPARPVEAGPAIK